ncbi:protein FAR-RED IMPAIRED RESPONSE 1-like [Tripterygium wilfordii]|uniref:protein FAR-RED IMPAIRED RESPONSE 1-like n=1 Tax=Tripterygium wilfordii TaxID=458696 RepID=UPI0018F839FF|nr:protein FAR-RED IMPAIRED RESPONSE 1-like [Tripterygium wilfordii]
MGNKAPKTIFTDQDQAMSNAIEKVFPNTRHRLCEWHIAKNAATNIPQLYAQPEFKNKFFTKLLHGCENEEEFQSTWDKMVQCWDVGSNKWLKRLYELRVKWCPAFSFDTLSAGIRSTQRSESTNNVFHHMACKSMTLTEFVKHYEENARKMREAEIEDDYSCARGKPKLYVRNNGILKHASTIYTHVIFRKFQDEFLQGISEVILDKSLVKPMHVYTLKNEGGKRIHVVHFNPADLSITCSCLMFESKGWLCRHALRVLNVEYGVKNIPPQYVLKRWTKSVKEGIVKEFDFGMSEGDLASSKTIRFNNLMRKEFSIMSISAAHIDTTKIANENLDVIIDRLKSYRENNALDNRDLRIGNPSLAQGRPSLLDWPKVRAKGVGYGRQKGPLEKRRKRATKNAPSTSQPGYAPSTSQSGYAPSTSQSGFTHFDNDYGQNMTFTSLLSQASSYNYPEYGVGSMGIDMEP